MPCGPFAAVTMTMRALLQAVRRDHAEAAVTPEALY
jgi:hypothetical protein